MHLSWDARVGLRRQIKFLVRRGVGSNPTLNISFANFPFCKSHSQHLLFPFCNSCKFSFFFLFVLCWNIFFLKQTPYSTSILFFLFFHFPLSFFNFCFLFKHIFLYKPHTQHQLSFFCWNIFFIQIPLSTSFFFLFLFCSNVFFYGFKYHSQHLFFFFLFYVETYFLYKSYSQHQFFFFDLCWSFFKKNHSQHQFLYKVNHSKHEIVVTRNISIYLVFFLNYAISFISIYKLSTSFLTNYRHRLQLMPR